MIGPVLWQITLPLVLVMRKSMLLPVQRYAATGTEVRSAATGTEKDYAAAETEEGYAATRLVHEETFQLSYYGYPLPCR